MRRTSPRGCRHALEANDTEALVDYRDRAPGADARIRPTSTSCRCTWRGAPRASIRAPKRVVSGFESGALALNSWLFH